MRWSRLAPAELLRPHDGRFSVLRHDAASAGDAWNVAEVPPTSNHVVILVEHALKQPLEVIAAGRRHRVVTPPGSLFLMPAGAERAFRSRGRRERVVNLHLDPAWLAALGEEAGFGGAGAAPPLLVAQRDPGFAPLLAAWQAGVAASAGQSLFHEHWAMLAVLQLLRVSAPAPRVRITPARLERVRGFAEANLAADLSLSDLADAAGLSRFHFARAFRQQTGLSPHAWLMRLRCEHAAELMRTTALPLSVIAARCGFAHQAHFTHVFRRVFGATPGRWRAATQG